VRDAIFYRRNNIFSCFEISEAAPDKPSGKDKLEKGRALGSGHY
jgi:hypothetical protein